MLSLQPENSGLEGWPKTLHEVIKGGQPTQGQLAGGKMSSIPIAEHAVRRIAVHCAHANEPGAFGIRPEPAAAIVRRYGGQTRRAPGRGRIRVGRRNRRGWCDRR